MSEALDDPVAKEAGREKLERCLTELSEDGMLTLNNVLSVSTLNAPGALAFRDRSAFSITDEGREYVVSNMAPCPEPPTVKGFSG